MSKTAIFCVALVAALCVSQIADAQAPTSSQRSTKRILDCTLDSANLDECNLNTYVERVAMYAAPGVVFAVLLFLFCPWYCCGKYCCNCCGGRNQAPGCCCVPGDENIAMTYSGGDVLRNKLFAVVCLLLTVAAFVWGFVGSAEVIGGMRGFGDAISDIPSVLDREITAIDDALVLDRWDSSTNSTIRYRLFSNEGNTTKTAAETNRNDLQKNIDDSLGDYNARVDQAAEALWFMFLVPLVLIAAGFVFAICNCRKVLPMMIVWFLFLFTFVLWLCHALFGISYHIFYDMCFEIDQITNEKANVIANIAGCEDSMFTSFRTQFKSLEVTQAENTCNAIANRCWIATDTNITNLNNGRVYDCPADLSCTGKTFADMVDLLENSFKIHPTIMTMNTDEARNARCRDTSVDCTIQRCSWDCAVPTSQGGYLLEIGLSSAEIYVTFLGAKQVSNAIDILGAKYASCDSAMRLVIGVLDAPCKRLVSGLNSNKHASGLLSFAMTLGIWVFAWGAKRFIPGDHIGRPLINGEPASILPVQVGQVVTAATGAEEKPEP